MIIHDLSTVCQSGGSHGGSHGIEHGPQTFQDFAGNHRGTRNERGSISEEALLLMTVNMKQPDGGIDYQIPRQKMSDALLQMYDILTSNIVDKQKALTWIEIGGLASLKQSPINVFLLLPAEQICGAIGSKASMPCTGNGYDAGNVASLGLQHGQFDCPELILTWCFLAGP